MVITHIEDVLPSRHGKLSTNRRADVERVELHLVTGGDPVLLRSVFRIPPLETPQTTEPTRRC